MRLRENRNLNSLLNTGGAWFDVLLTFSFDEFLFSNMTPTSASRLVLLWTSLFFLYFKYVSHSFYNIYRPLGLLFWIFNSYYIYIYILIKIWFWKIFYSLRKIKDVTDLLNILIFIASHILAFHILILVYFH